MSHRCSSAHCSCSTRAGPSSVTPGKSVTYRLIGAAVPFLQAVPTRNRDGNCCGARIAASGRTDATGSAELTFVWPRSYGTRHRQREPSHVAVATG